jgi:hypothetical protein
LEAASDSLPETGLGIAFNCVPRAALDFALGAISDEAVCIPVKGAFRIAFVNVAGISFTAAFGAESSVVLVKPSDDVSAAPIGSVFCSGAGS